MRVRPRRPLAVAAAALLTGAASVVGAVAVASPAMAAEFCHNLQVTISISTAGNYSGTAGDDVVLIKSSNGMTYYEPVDGNDHICVTGSSPITVWANGDGHVISLKQGNNVVYGSDGPDDIRGGSGNDVIKGNKGNDRLDGYGGNDYIRGNDGDDQIDGGTGDDCLAGGGGYDEIIGSDGNDDILVAKTDRFSSTHCAPAEWDNSEAATTFRNTTGSGGGEVYPGNGDDRVFGSNSADYISEGSGGGDDIIRGYNGNDSIQGGKGSDYLNGGYGNDSLADSYSDNAADMVYGGPGTDQFGVVSGGGDICYSEWGPATIACSGSQG